MKLIIRKVSSLLVGVVALSSLFVFNASSVQAQEWPDYDYSGGWIKSVNEVSKPDGNGGTYKCLEISLALNASGSETKTIFICQSNCPSPACCQVCAACYDKCKSVLMAHASSSAKEKVIFVTLSDGVGTYAQGLPNGVAADGSLNCHCFIDVGVAFAGM